MSEVLLQLQDVGFSHPGRRVFQAVNFELRRGERVALVGANGIGKTTLLHVLVGLLEVDQGRVIAFGEERRNEAGFREVRRRAGLVFQDPDDQLFCPTVLEDVAFGPLNLGHDTGQAVRIARDTLQALELQHLADRVTHKLSGGEKRLVSLAGVLAMQPDVLLLDEPTNGLDEAAEETLLRHLESLPQAMFFVSHDRRLVERLATRAVLLQDATLVPAVLHQHPHSHTHSHVHIHAAGVDAGHEHGTPTPPHLHGHGD